jgi:hypothetical protein
MEILVKRVARKDTYTIGKLYIDGAYICDTLEDKDRGLRQDMNISVVKAQKIAKVTAIPTGRYKVTLGVKSPKFSEYKFYMDFCGGYLPRLLNVPGFEGILMHATVRKDGAEATGTIDWTDGCILVGYNKIVGKLINTVDAFKKVYALLKGAKGDIWITVE